VKGVYEALRANARKGQPNRLALGQEVVPMDTHLVRVVCASCEANYRIPAETVSGRVVDYCCSNCGAVIEVNGTAIELVAPTRPGQDPRDLLPRTPEPTNVVPSSASFRVNAPAWRSGDTPAGLVRVKAPPPPPSTEVFAARRPPAPVHSSMPPAMSMPAREMIEAERPTLPPSDVPPLGETHVFSEPRSSRKGWLAVATLIAAVAVAFLGRAIGSLASTPSPAAPAAQPVDPQTPVTARLQAGDFRGTATDPAAQASAPTVVRPAASPTEVSVESLKTEKRRKKAKSLKTGGAEETEPVAEEAVESPAPPPPTFVAPEPPPPPGPEFSREAAQSALEDAAALAATCRQEDTTAGAVRVAVTFVPSGQATVAVVESGVVRGTPVGSCVASKFRTAKVPPFSGTKVTVHKTMMF
jgi:hypothetical protein